jgi:hypothetical protein
MPVLIIPIAVAVPPMFVLIPPPVIRAPAILPSFMQFMSRMVGLPAVPTMMLHSLMQFVVGFRQTVLALRFVRTKARRAGEQQHSGQRRSRYNQLSVLQDPQTPFIYHFCSYSHWRSLVCTRVSTDRSEFTIRRVL